MKKLILLALLSICGCGVLSGLYVSPQSAAVSINTFDALEIIATGYVRLPPCVTGNLGICRSSIAVANIVPAIRAGRVARDQIVTLLQQNAGANIPIDNFNTLQSIITTLQTIYAQYNIQKQ